MYLDWALQRTKYKLGTSINPPILTSDQHKQLNLVDYKEFTKIERYDHTVYHEEEYDDYGDYGEEEDKDYRNQRDDEME